MSDPVLTDPENNRPFILLLNKGILTSAAAHRHHIYHLTEGLTKSDGEAFPFFLYLKKQRAAKCFFPPQEKDTVCGDIL